MKRNKNKSTSLIICIFFLTIFILNIVISYDIYHIWNCVEEDCYECIVIHQAENTLKSLHVYGIIIISLILLFPKIFSIKPMMKRYTNTLINLKTQLNE